MTNNNCSCRITCTGLAIVASIVIGIIAAILRYTAVITLTTPFLWAIFGIALGFIFLLLILAPNYRGFSSRCCVCPNINTALIGAVATIFLALVLVGVTFVATSVIGAIIAGAFIGAFSLTVLSIACLVKCAVGCFMCE